MTIYVELSSVRVRWFSLDCSSPCAVARVALQTPELARVSACQAPTDVVRDHGDWCLGCYVNLVFGRERL
jgi:hypothetical protein